MKLMNPVPRIAPAMELAMQESVNAVIILLTMTAVWRRIK